MTQRASFLDLSFVRQWEPPIGMDIKLVYYVYSNHKPGIELHQSRNVRLHIEYRKW